MDDFNLESLVKNLSPQEMLYSFGAVISGVFYGITKFFKKSPDEPARKVESELIEILKNHVDAAEQSNKQKDDRIEELKDQIENLEKELFELKLEMRDLKTYNNEVKNFCPYVPNLSEFVTSNYNINTCCLSEDCYKIKECFKRVNRRKQERSIEFADRRHSPSPVLEELIKGDGELDITI